MDLLAFALPIGVANRKLSNIIDHVILYAY